MTPRIPLPPITQSDLHRMRARSVSHLLPPIFGVLLALIVLMICFVLASQDWKQALIGALCILAVTLAVTAVAVAFNPGRGS